MSTDKKTDARQLDHATLEVMRLRAIEAAKAGMKATGLPKLDDLQMQSLPQALTD